MQLIRCLLSDFYLNMFRASLCPSLGEQDCVLLHMVFCTVTGRGKNRKMCAIESLRGIMRSKHSWDFVCVCVWPCVYVFGHVCMCMDMCVCVWPCVYVYDHVYVYGRVYMYMVECVCV